jgi:hypothetical protein
VISAKAFDDRYEFFAAFHAIKQVSRMKSSAGSGVIGARIIKLPMRSIIDDWK